MVLSLFVSLLGGPAAAAGKAVDGVVNLNTAQPATLLLLPGIGPAKVERIIAYRRRRPFRTIDELVRVKGIGRKMVRALRSHLAVTGPTTATPAIARAVPDAAHSSAATAARRRADSKEPQCARALRRRIDSEQMVGRVPSMFPRAAERGYCLRPP
jgi:competence protein ComEA